jgi:hypothetical protein
VQRVPPQECLNRVTPVPPVGVHRNASIRMSRQVLDAFLPPSAGSPSRRTGGGRYRVRPHLGVLDELPTLGSRLLTAAAVVATVVALRHEQAAVTTFLVNAAASIGPVATGSGTRPTIKERVALETMYHAGRTLFAKIT